MNIAKHVLFAFLVGTPALVVHAQILPATAPETLLADTPHDSTRIKLLFSKADDLLYVSPDTSLQLSLHAMALAEKNNYNQQKIVALHKIGAAHWAKGDSRNAMRYFQQSLAAAEKIKDTLYIARSIGSTGLIFSNSGLPRMAIDYHKKALALYYYLKHHERIAVSLSNIGKNFLELSHLDSARHYLVQAEEMKEKYQIASPIIYFNLSDVHFRLGNYEVSKKYIAKIETDIKKRRDIRALARGYQLLAEIQLVEGNEAIAKINAEKALQLAEPTQISEILHTIYLTYSNVLRKTGRTEDAFLYFEKSVSTRDSLQSINVQNALITQEFLLREKEIVSLKEQQKLQQQVRSIEEIAIGGLVVIILLASSLAYYFYYSREQRKKLNQRLEAQNLEILQRNEQLHEKTIELLNLGNFKNNALSIITHDLRGPFNSLTTLLDGPIKKMLAKNDIESIVFELSKHIKNITALTDTLLTWANSQMSRFKPELKEIDLQQFFTNKILFFQDLATAKGIRVIHAQTKPMIVSTDEAILDMILRNFITNAIKYCKNNDTITLSALVTETGVVVQVKDTGPGMPKVTLETLLKNSVLSREDTTGYKGAGIGLLLCKDLAQLVNGSLQIQSEEGQGTTCQLVLPVSVR